MAGRGTPEEPETRGEEVAGVLESLSTAELRAAAARAALSAEIAFGEMCTAPTHAERARAWRRRADALTLRDAALGAYRRALDMRPRQVPAPQPRTPARRAVTPAERALEALEVNGGALSPRMLATIAGPGAGTPEALAAAGLATTDGARVVITPAGRRALAGGAP